MNSTGVLCTVLLAVLYSTAALPAVEHQPRFYIYNTTGAGTYQAGAHGLFTIYVDDSDNEEGNDDWKVCKWTRLRDNEYCQFNYKCEGFFCDIGSGNFYMETVCSAGIKNRASFYGEDPNFHNRICGISFSTMTKEDSGTWKVEAEECKFTGCGSDHGNDVIVTTSISVTVV